MNQVNFFPALNSPTTLGKDYLHARLLNREVSITATPDLIRLVSQHCDGTRSLEDILKEVPLPSRDRFERFVYFLLEQGVVIHAKATLNK